MKLIPKQQLEELRARSDIVEVIGSHIRLQRAGSSFKALCPFHKEKTPSFFVSPARQTFHCFGCGAGGDVFRFIMRYHGVDFPGAVQLLAQRAGMVIEWEEGDQRAATDRETLFKVLSAIADFYHRMLISDPAAEEARQYLRSRDLVPAVKPFRLGYAPVRPDALQKFAASRKFDLEWLEKAGIWVRPEGRSEGYDRFRGRLVIPIADELGRVIGFSARVLPSDPSPAKYVNSPETPLFRKSRVLFALDRARRAIVDSRRAILCEGQIDVIRCHLAGIENAVAAQGTAVTEEHAHLLRRYADEVVVMLDADAAGEKAALRSAEVFLAGELTCRFVRLPPGEDPDSLIRKAGRRAVDELLQQSRSVMHFLVDVHRSRGDLQEEVGVRRAIQEALTLVAASPSPTQRELLLRELAALLRVSEWSLREQLRHRPPPSRLAPAPEPTASTTPVKRPADEVGAVALLLWHPELQSFYRQYLEERLLTDPVCVQVYRVLRDTPPEQWQSALFGADMEESVVTFVAELMTRPMKLAGDVYSPESAARDYITALWRNELQRRRDRYLRSAQLTPEIEREINLLSHHIGLLKKGWEDAEPIIELHKES